MLLIQVTYQQTYDVTSQAKLNSAFTEISNNSNKSSITSIRLNGSITSRSGITDVSGVSSFSQLTSMTSLVFQFNYSDLTTITPICNSIKNLTQLKTFELHLYTAKVKDITCLREVLTNLTNLERFLINMTANQSTEMESVTQPIKNLTKLKYIYLNFSSNSGINDISSIDEALQNKPALTELYLYFYSTQITSLTPIKNSFNNLPVLWRINFRLEDNTYDKSNCNAIFTKMPNLERVNLILREGYKYEEMKYVVDQFQSIPKLWYLYIEYHYGNTVQFLDLSEWNNLFSISAGANKIKYLQYMNNYSYQNVDWQQLQNVISDLPNLEQFLVRQHGGRVTSMPYMTNISHPNIQRIWLIYTSGSPIVWTNLQNALGTLPALFYVNMNFSDNGLTDADLTDFGLIYKSLQNRSLKHFYVQLNTNLITNLQGLANKAGQQPFKCTDWCYMYCMSCTKLTSLAGLKNVMESVFDAPFQKYFHFYMQNSVIADITELKTAFDTFVNIRAIYLNFENNKITNWNQLQGMYDNKPLFEHVKLYLSGNPITNQVALNDVLSPVFWQGGPPLINNIYCQFTDPTYDTTTKFTSMRSGKRYLTFTNEGHCLSTYDMAKYFYLDEQQNPFCADCLNSKCHLCVNNTACTKCRWSTVARELPNCNCPIGYYDSSTNHECDKCNRVCKSCSNSTSCDICVTSTAPRIKSSFCSCPSRFYDSDVDNCANCISNCEQCNNGSTCQTCVSGYYINSTNTCAKCPLKYETCNNSTTGTKCQGSNRTTNLPNCECSSGFVDVDSTNLQDCVACTSPCKTCINSKTKCLSCVDGYYLSGNSCIKCPNKFSKCNSPTNGLECQGNNRSSSTPTCPCNSTFYDDNTNADCPSCTNNCKTCNTATFCNSCVNGYYLNNNTCPQCPLKYETCNNSTTGTKCQGSNRTTNLPNCECSSGFVDVDGSNLKDCVACTSPCKTCINSKTKCLSCVDGYYLSGNSCIKCPNKFSKCTSPTNGLECQGNNRSSSTPTCPCNSTFYDDNTNADCPSCTNNCKTCNTATFCNSCLNGYYLNNNTCPQCPLKYETCNNSTTGTKCQGSNRTTNLPNCECSSGFVDVDGSNLKDCVACTSPCKTCINSKTKCQSCINGYYLNGNSCPMCLQKFETCSDLNTGTKCQGANRTSNLPDCECSAGFVDVDGNDQQDCEQCTSPCKTCINQKQKCLSCIDGYYLDGNICKKCQEKFDTCSDFNTGLTCKGANRLTDLPCLCEHEYFDDNTNADCQQCQYPCVRCSTLNICQTCYDNINRKDDCSCEVGYYDINQSCQKCHNKCATCQNEHDTCQTCNDNDNREQSQNCICKDGFYDLGNTLCEICISPCEHCTSNTVCTKCLYTGLNRHSTPTCLCEDGYYEDQSTHECKKCSSKCSKCSDYNTCTECDSTPNTFRSLDLNLNCACNDTYYEDESQNLICQQCQYPCINCISSSECQSSSFYTSINRNIDCSCESGYFDNGNLCQKCDKKCQECAITADTCQQSCSDQNTRKNFPDCSCIEGLKEIGMKQCGICANKCEECLGDPTACTICAKGIGRDQQFYGLQNKDKCKCQEGYFDDGINSDCQICGSQCKTCSDAQSCDTCLISSLDPKLNCLEQVLPSSAVVIFDSVLQKYVEAQCSIYCDECEDQVDKCTQCKVGIRRQNNPPLCQCEQGYHDFSGTKIDCIEKCHYSCKTCSSYNICQKCPLGRVIDPITMQCVCQQKHYEDKNLKCVPCLFKYKGICMSECPKNTYIDQKTQTCEEFNFNFQSSDYTLFAQVTCLIIIQVFVVGFIAYKIKNMFKKSEQFIKLSKQEGKSSKSNSDEGSQTVEDIQLQINSP